MVYSIDMKFKLKDTMKHLPNDYIERLKFIQEDSNSIHLKEKFGCILVDGNHTFPAVRKDTMNFWNNLDDNGYMIFHDYGNKEGVTKFVDDWVNHFNQARVVKQEHNLIVLQNV